MSDLRTAANQMLEALEGGADSWQLVGPAIDALKEALAEPFSPEAISTTQTAWKMGYEARKAEEQAKPEPPPEAQTEAEKIAYCAGWWAALEKARKEEPVMKPAGVVTSMVKGGVTWHIWPDQMPDGTKLYAAAPIIKPKIKEDNSVPQAQQFLYNAWADEQIQKEKK